MASVWDHITVAEVIYASYVDRKTAKHIHTDRPYHGLVLNDGNVHRVYVFSDGTVLDTPPNAFFYLPRGSSYRVLQAEDDAGSCYAVNFGVTEEFFLPPFSLSLRDTEGMRRLFRTASEIFRDARESRRPGVIGTLYQIIYLAEKEKERAYLPTGKQAILLPAEEVIRTRFTDPALAIRDLAALCGITEAYFRRLYKEIHGETPLATVTRLRIGRAKEALASGQFSAAQVARICGYAEPCYFSREFRRYTGLSPGEYRKKRGTEH